MKGLIIETGVKDIGISFMKNNDETYRKARKILPLDGGGLMWGLPSGGEREFPYGNELEQRNEFLNSKPFSREARYRIRTRVTFRN